MNFHTHILKFRPYFPLGILLLLLACAASALAQTPAATPAPTPVPKPAATPAPPPAPTPNLELKDDPNLHMVAVEALVVEVNEERTRDLGLTYGGNGGNDSGGIVQGGEAQLGRALQTVNVPILIPGADGQNAVGFTPRLPGLGLSLTGMNVGTAQISAKLRALLDTGEAAVRTRPVAVALNKTPVRIETVNEGPVLIIAGQAAAYGQLSIDFRKVGVLMEVTPEIVSLRPGVATLAINKLEVSSVSNLVTTRSIDRPVFVKSAAQQTRITLAEGETFLFGGLKTRRTEHIEQRVPVLGAIPLVGLLFRSQQDIERNLDVLFFITPHILEPGQNFLLPYDFKNQKALGIHTALAEK